ncbi:putative cytosine-specific methyltransferase [Candidatus Nitrososphaera gargensis Ga9.2]|uniref:DNA (cytosine-5-)-methyltransferase n=1 Tax=Nitrososphaera gargensis (strain Ga9.2) TaxID=1237085 RepID=K0IEK9_NITGG|nr:DNA cytosine methyltransferase [Candidatus Nitrososphaera gargensis]AFU58185.1 putative cytosine-specific methyltransferase [Candidatus Nitrososphaera gargensis Ga9.2]
MNDGPTFIDLFCGAGGFSLGFVKAGFKHVLGVDNWNTVCETYQANIGNAVCQDLRIFDGKPFVGKIDVVIGSPPCQTFSSANTKTRECNTELCDEFMRIVNEVKPKVWIMENVPECIDYVQAPFKEVFYAGDFGVLQGRERAFFSNIKLKPDKIGQKYLDTEQSAKQLCLKSQQSMLG